jgi:regulator of RNase E activity RraA
VQAGDLLIGDADGIAVVPRDHAADVLPLALALMEKERARVAEIDRGMAFKAEIDDTLRKKGVIE